MAKIRVIICVIITALLVGMTGPASVISASANETEYMLLRVSRNCPIRKESHNQGETIRRAEFNSLLYASEKIITDKKTEWYYLPMEEAWVFSGNVEYCGMTTLPGTTHTCVAEIKSVIGSSYCASDNPGYHYKTDTITWLCRCGNNQVDSGYEIVEEKCSYETTSWDKSTCKFCKYEEGNLTVITDKVVTGAKNLGSTFANELKSEDTLGKMGTTLVLGNAAPDEDATVSGATTELALSLLGADIGLDARDAIVDTTQFFDNVDEKGVWAAMGIIALDVVAFLPIIGSLKKYKSVDTIVDATKSADKIGNAVDSVQVLKKVDSLKTADIVTDTVKSVDKIDTATDVSKAAVKTSESVADTTITGAKRGPKEAHTGAHNLKIEEVASQVTDGEVIAGGGYLKEKLIPTPAGIKSGRRPDILVKKYDGTIYGINVGKTTASGSPIKREIEAIYDLEDAGIPMFYVPYDIGD